MWVEGEVSPANKIAFLQSVMGARQLATAANIPLPEIAATMLIQAFEIYQEFGYTPQQIDALVGECLVMQFGKGAA